MKKLLSTLLVISLITVLSVIFVACDKDIGDTIDANDVVGFYDLDTETDNFEYKYIEIFSDGSWSMVYKESGSDVVSVEGTYSINNGDVVFSGNTIATDITLDIVEGKPVIEYMGATYECREETSSTLIAPTATIDDGTLSWNAVENADLYIVYEGTIIISVQEGLTFNLRAMERFVADTDYPISVIARDLDNLYNDSILSNVIVFSYTIAQLAAPTGVSAGNYHLYWNKVANAVGYYVYKNGVFWEGFYGEDNNFYPFSIGTPGTYDISVIAVGDGINYADSTAAHTSYVAEEDWETTNLSAPNASIEGNALTWTAVNGASSYTVYANKFIIAENATSPYTINLFYKGNYKISVKAKGDLVNNLDSTISNEVDYILNVTGDTLPTPHIELIGDYLYWDNVQGADKYYIKEGDTKLAETDDVTFDLTTIEIVGFEPFSEHTIYVVAVNEDVAINNSQNSNTVAYTVPEPQKLLQPSGLEEGANGYIFWDKDNDYTTHYLIYVDGDLYDTIANPEELAMEVSYQLLITEAGEYEITIIAHDETGVFANSLPSSVLTINIY